MRRAAARQGLVNIIPYTTVGTARRDYVYGCTLADPASGRRQTGLVMQCDEGSDVCSITSSVAQALGAAPVAQGQLVGVDGVAFTTPIYSLSLYTAYGIVSAHPFWQMPLSGVAGLIGNDVLSQGIFEESAAGFWLAIGTAAPPESTTLADVLLVAGLAAAVIAVAVGSGRRVA